MPKTTKKKERDDPELIREWSLPVAATLGSAVRVKGILQEIRSRLPSAVRKSLDMQSSALTLVRDFQDSVPRDLGHHLRGTGRHRKTSDHPTRDRGDPDDYSFRKEALA